MLNVVEIVLENLDLNGVIDLVK